MSASKDVVQEPVFLSQGPASLPSKVLTSCSDGIAKISPTVNHLFYDVVEHRFCARFELLISMSLQILRVAQMKTLVLSVDLSRRALHSVPRLDQFQALESLNISRNYIDVLMNLPSTLKVLNASHNLLVDFSPILSLQQLETCDISHNNIMFVNLSGSMVSSSLKQHGLAKLTSLDLSHNRIEALKGFKNLPNLVSLSLSSNNIFSLDEFKYFSVNNINPKHLTAVGNPVSEHLNYISKIGALIPSLEQIDGITIARQRDWTIEAGKSNRLQTYSEDSQSNGMTEGRTWMITKSDILSSSSLPASQGDLTVSHGALTETIYCSDESDPGEIRDMTSQHSKDPEDLAFVAEPKEYPIAVLHVSVQTDNSDVTKNSLEVDLNEKIQNTSSSLSGSSNSAVAPFSHKESEYNEEVLLVHPFVNSPLCDGRLEQKTVEHLPSSSSGSLRSTLEPSARSHSECNEDILQIQQVNSPSCQDHISHEGTELEAADEDVVLSLCFQKSFVYDVGLEACILNIRCQICAAIQIDESRLSFNEVLSEGFFLFVNFTILRSRNSAEGSSCIVLKNICEQLCLPNSALVQGSITSRIVAIHTRPDSSHQIVFRRNFSGALLERNEVVIQALQFRAEISKRNSKSIVLCLWKWVLRKRKELMFQIWMKGKELRLFYLSEHLQRWRCAVIQSQIQYKHVWLHCYKLSSYQTYNSHTKSTTRQYMMYWILWFSETKKRKFWELKLASVIKTWSVIGGFTAFANNLIDCLNEKRQLQFIQYARNCVKINAMSAMRSLTAATTCMGISSSLSQGKRFKLSIKVFFNWKQQVFQRKQMIHNLGRWWKRSLLLQVQLVSFR